MFKWIDWPVLARQALLVVVPVLVSRGILPAYLADPVVDLLTYFLGTVVVGYVIYLGQRREQPAIKIAETAQLPEVRHIAVKDPDLAEDIPDPKVTP